MSSDTNVPLVPMANPQAPAKKREWARGSNMTPLKRANQTEFRGIMEARGE